MKSILTLGIMVAATSAFATGTGSAAKPAPAAPAAVTQTSQPTQTPSTAKAALITEAQAKTQCAVEKAPDMAKCVSDKMGTSQKK